MFHLNLQDPPRRPLAPLWEGYGAKINREMGRTLQIHSQQQQLPPQQAIQDPWGTPLVAAEPDREGMRKFGYNTSNPNTYTSVRSTGWWEPSFDTKFEACRHLPSFEPYTEFESLYHAKQ